MFGRLVKLLAGAGVIAAGAKVVKDILDADDEEKKIIELDIEEEIVSDIEE